MACENWNESWIAHLYAEAEPEQEAALAAHLERCSSCRATLDELASTRQLLRSAAPAVPGAPRVVVLRAPARRPIGSFAAGLASAAALAAALLLLWPRPSAPSTSPVHADASPARESPTIAGLQATIRTLEERLARVESRPSAMSATDTAISRQELQRELDQLTRRFDKERERDLESVVRAISATEARTSTWLDQARETVHLLALRQDPRFTEN